MSFKLLGIRPLSGCNKDFLKNLEENRIYKFFSDYKFYNNDKEIIKNEDLDVTSIKYQPEGVFLQNLYGKIINISAIVGKNGSGKSALIQLLCSGIYQLSVIKEIIKVNDIQKEKIEGLKIQIFYSYKNRKVNGELQEDFHVLNIDGDIIRLNDDYTNGKFNYDRDDYDYLSESLPFLFYNIINNYSIYGLNPNEVGDWINKIYIKNDGYKTPIVLNPYRENGNIDVNLETYFAKNRLLSNILNVNFSAVGLKKKTPVTPKELLKKNDYSIKPYNLDHKRPSKIEFVLKYDKFKSKENKIDLKYLKYFPKYLHLIFNNLYLSEEEKRNYTKDDISQLLGKPTIVEQYAINYIFYKLEKINLFFNQTKGVLSEKKYIEYLKKISDDFSDSHVLFKVYQSINFLKYDIYKKFKSSTEFEISIDDDDDESVPNKMDSLILFEREKIREKHAGSVFVIYPSLLVTNMAFLPPPIFDIDIVFSENQGRLSDLSSGEKQIIYSIQGILYHLINISSKNSFRGSNAKTSYQFINIIFDEVELYFHPDMQRKFISSLIIAIKETYLQGIEGINILFVTHSPFILSDIPKQNVLFLEVDKESKQAKPSVYEGYNTFGANIHEMLTNGFFLGSTKGEFVLSTINDFLDYYNEIIKVKKQSEYFNKTKENYIDKRKSYSSLISLIGEDYIRKILENHLNELDLHFSDLSYEETQISLLEAEKIMIDEKINRLKNL